MIITMCLLSCEVRGPSQIAPKLLQLECALIFWGMWPFPNGTNWGSLEEMEEKKLSTVSLALLMLLSLWLMISPASACPPDRSGCKGCIVDQMKYACPSCVPLLRCMAKCLWGGSSRPKCIKRCDCNADTQSIFLVISLETIAAWCHIKQTLGSWWRSSDYVTSQCMISFMILFLLN